MPYEYLDHVADIGLQASGETFSIALQDAGQGLLELQVDTTTVTGRDTTTISASATDPAALLVAFLNAILAEQDIRRWFFNSLRVDSVEETSGTWRVEATLWGEPIDLERHEVANEVKAATYAGLRAELTPGHVLLRCVLDI
jgi:SHS2 domain-containing protein